MKIQSSRLFIYSCTGCITLYGIYAVAEGCLIVNGGDILKTILKPLMVLMILGIALAIERIENCVSCFLVWLAKYSLYVYLFHTWFSGTLRVVLRKVGITNCWLQAISGIIVGLAGSVLLGVIIMKVPMFRIWIEPLNVIRLREKRKEAE